MVKVTRIEGAVFGFGLAFGMFIISQTLSQPNQIESTDKKQTTISRSRSWPDREPESKIDNAAAHFDRVLGNKAGLYNDADKQSKDYSKTILVTASNYQYREVLANWECYAKRLKLKWVVIAMDPKMYELLGENNSILVNGSYTESGAETFGSAGFSNITCNKLLMVAKILRAGYNVIFSDPDNIFTADLMSGEAFGDMGALVSSNRYDFIYSVNLNAAADDVECQKCKDETVRLNNGEVPSYGIRERRTMANTGLYFARATPKVYAWMESTVDMCATSNLDDQSLFWQWTLLRLGKGWQHPAGVTKIKHCTTHEWGHPKQPENPKDIWLCHLDMFKYVTGRNVTQYTSDMELKAYHSNFVSGTEKKISKLQNWTKPPGLWKEGCQ